MIHLRNDVKALFAGEKTVSDYFSISGPVLRHSQNRYTLRFERAGRAFYIKCHDGIGWREIIKQLVHLRWPQFGAYAEQQAILKLEQLGISTMRIAAYGEEGINPARKRSFIVTDEIGPAVSLEDFCRDWPWHPPDSSIKYQLIKKVAQIMSELHQNGVNHRDCYLCHFLMNTRESDELHLIDLHRVQIRSRTPQRWIVKDIGGLYFSAMDIGLNHRDLLRFIRWYTNQPLRMALAQPSRFWRRVQTRARSLYRSEWNRDPPVRHQ